MERLTFKQASEKLEQGYEVACTSKAVKFKKFECEYYFNFIGHEKYDWFKCPKFVVSLETAVQKEQQLLDWELIR